MSTHHQTKGCNTRGNATEHYNYNHYWKKSTRRQICYCLFYEQFAAKIINYTPTVTCKESVNTACLERDNTDISGHHSPQEALLWPISATVKIMFTLWQQPRSVGTYCLLIVTAYSEQLRHYFLLLFSVHMLM